MDKIKIFVILLMFILVQSFGWGKSMRKSFACRLELKNGRVFQTLILGTDWREITPKKTEISQTSVGNFEISNFKIVDGNLFIEFKIDEPTSVRINIYNLLGEKVVCEVHSLSKGNGTFFVPIKSLPYGVYICEVSSDSIKKIFKFLKL